MGEMAAQWARAQPLVTNYLRSVVLGVNDYHDAEDLVQKVAYAAASRYGEYDASRPFTAWVLGIAKYKVLEYRCGALQERHVFGDAALERISHVYEYEDVSSHELKPASIAEQLGQTTNAICLLLSRTRKALAVRN